MTVIGSGSGGKHRIVKSYSPYSPVIHNRAKSSLKPGEARHPQEYGLLSSATGAALLVRCSIGQPPLFRGTQAECRVGRCKRGHDLAGVRPVGQVRPIRLGRTSAKKETRRVDSPRPVRIKPLSEWWRLVL